MNDISIVGQLRMLPAKTLIFSTINQTSFRTCKDEVILITHTCWGSSLVFCKPQKAEGYILMGIDEKWVDKSNDEWHLDYNDTVENKKQLRKGMLTLDMVYSDELKNKDDGNK